MNKSERLIADGFSAKTKPILFYRPDDDYGGFSQFSQHEIYLVDPWTGLLRRYKTGEHRFQAMKAKNKFDHDFVCKANTPSIAKFRGSAKGGMDLREDWGNTHNSICWYVMLEVCIAKATRHIDIWENLRSTNCDPIYEDSETDDIWGWRFRSNYSGKNLLGRCWMETRQILFAQ